MNIPDEAVEAAAKAMSANWKAMHTNESLGFQRMLAVRALEAAAPHLMAPRVVTTVEELDALPLNTIILDAEELPLYKDDSMRVPEWCFGDDPVDVHFPATVIHEPQPEK